MTLKIRIFNFISLFILIILSTDYSLALGPLPSHTSYISENGQYIYVKWLPPRDLSSTEMVVTDYFARAPIKIQKSDFPQNGLFHFKTKKFLWKAISNCENYHEDIEGVPTDDGRFLIERKIYHSNSKRNEFTALKIYENGDFKKEYLYSDFCLSTGAIVDNISCVPFRWEHTFKLDNKNKRVIIEACNKKHIIQLGDQIVKSSPWSFNNYTLFQFLVAGLLIFVFIKFCRLIKNSKSRLKKSLLILLNLILILLFAIDLFLLFATSPF